MLRDTRRQKYKSKWRGIFATRTKHTEQLQKRHRCDSSLSPPPPVRCSALRLSFQLRLSQCSFPSTTSAQSGHSSREKDVGICSSRRDRSEELSQGRDIREHRLQLISSSTLPTETEPRRDTRHPSLLTPPPFLFSFLLLPFSTSRVTGLFPLTSFLLEEARRAAGEDSGAEKISQTSSRLLKALCYI